MTCLHGSPGGIHAGLLLCALVEYSRAPMLRKALLPLENGFNLQEVLLPRFRAFPGGAALSAWGIFRERLVASMWCASACARVCPVSTGSSAARPATPPQTRRQEPDFVVSGQANAYQGHTDFMNFKIEQEMQALRHQHPYTHFEIKVCDAPGAAAHGLQDTLRYDHTVRQPCDTALPHRSTNTRLRHRPPVPPAPTGHGRVALEHPVARQLAGVSRGQGWCGPGAAAHPRLGGRCDVLHLCAVLLRCGMTVVIVPVPRIHAVVPLKDGTPLHASTTHNQSALHREYQRPRVN